MAKLKWQELVLSRGDPDLTWELFHENSKTNPYIYPPSDEEVLAVMSMRWESLPFEGYPVIPLPLERTRLNLSVEEAITRRTTARNMAPVPIRLEDAATLLYCAYGITRQNIGTNFPRPFRTVPSGGALYPLELFFYSEHVQGLAPGIYYYNPTVNALSRVREGNESQRLAGVLVQPELVEQASMIVFITALFERSTFKYGDRGYRFVLLEAGHVAQNLNLAAVGLGLSCVNLGGFFDRRADDLLDLDGLAHSTVYLIAIGQDRE